MGCLSQQIDSLVEKARIACKTYSEFVKAFERIRQGVRESVKVVSKTCKALEYRVETRESEIVELVVRVSGGIVKLQLTSPLPQIVASGVVWSAAELVSRMLRRKRFLGELVAEYYYDVSTATLE